MPKVNFAEVPESSSSTVPDGKYLVEVDRIDEKQTRAKEEMWELWLKIVDGPHKGHAIKDNITWGHDLKGKAMQRTRLVLSRLGLDVSGELDVQPKMLKGRRAIVKTTIKPWDAPQYDKDTKEPIIDPVTGLQLTKPVDRNTIGFADYESVGAAGAMVQHPSTPVGAASHGADTGTSEESLPF
jgi:hypothetical protein